MDTKLTEADVARLLADPSADNRAQTAAKLADEFAHRPFSETERRLAEEIFRLMVRDAEVRVREALSRHLKESPDVPHDIALTLAGDVAAVAVPMLQFSEVLTDEDLLEIVRSQDPDKQVAVAARPTVSAPLSEALVETGDARAIETLVANQGADIPEPSLQKVVETMGESDSIQEKLVHRPTLPITVAERLVNTVSENLRQHLVTHHELPTTLATDLILAARERAVLGLSGDWGGSTAVEDLVRQLHAGGRLTPSIILRALCMGDIAFFETALAELVGAPLERARIVIHDRGPLGFQTIFDRSGLPKAFFPAMRAALDVAHELRYDGEANDRERFSRKLLERVLTQYGDLGVSLESDDLEYLLTKMSQLPATWRE